jgi:hypothetical protein
MALVSVPLVTDVLAARGDTWIPNLVTDMRAASQKCCGLVHAVCNAMFSQV